MYLLCFRVCFRCFNLIIVSSCFCCTYNWCQINKNWKVLNFCAKASTKYWKPNDGGVGASNYHIAWRHDTLHHILSCLAEIDIPPDKETRQVNPCNTASHLYIWRNSEDIRLHSYSFSVMGLIVLLAWLYPVQMLPGILSSGQLKPLFSKKDSRKKKNCQTPGLGVGADFTFT